VALLGFAGWLALGPGRISEPGAAPTPVDPAPSPRVTPSAAATGTPAPAPPPATPTPAPPPTPETGPGTPTPAPAPTAALSIEERLLRADEFLASGRFRRAYDEAKAVQQEDPTNEEARVIAQDAEAAIVIEDCIKNARAALDAGDRDRAKAEIQRGFAINPNEGRLRQLWREATQ
jgi:hypothetical protein